MLAARAARSTLFRGCPVAYRSARAPSDRDSTRVPITRSSRSTECTHTLHRRFARRCTRPATSAHVHGPRPHTPGEMQMLADFQQQQSSPRERVTSLTRGVTHLDILRVYPLSISRRFPPFDPRLSGREAWNWLQLQFPVYLRDRFSGR